MRAEEQLGPLVQSYVFHGDTAFFVSTINRQSSAVAAYGAVYAETMVWEWNHSTRERGALIGQDQGPADSIRTHELVVRSLHETGQIDCHESND